MGVRMDLNQVSVFIKVIQNNSFTAAAHDLGMPVSTVSFKVSMLEENLGVTLIQRTTRSLRITEAGKIFYDQCLRGLESLNAARDSIAHHQKEPSGVLKVSAPIDLGQVVLPDIIAQYSKKFPKVQFELSLSDRRVDLLAEGFDLALRAGQLKDSSLKAKKIGETYFALFARESYLKGKTKPEKPQDLREHVCIHFSNLSTDKWKLKNGSTNSEVGIKPHLVIDNLKTVEELVNRGAGIGLLPNFYCSPKNTGLIRLLPSWISMPHPVQFVFLQRKFMTAKVQEFIKLAEDPIRRQLQNQLTSGI